MDRIFIKGGKKLKGNISISGSKNATLPIIISSLLADGESIFFNVPMLNDVFDILSLLSYLGASITIDVNNKILKINSLSLSTYITSHKLIEKTRGSILIMGVLISKFKKAKLYFPGGCAIGSRPINLHLEAFKKLGVKINFEGNYFYLSVNKLKGANIIFKIKTVTGTENVMMAAVMAEGTTVLYNAAMEPEIVSLSRVLNLMGAKIYGAGTSRIIIQGVKKLLPVKFRISPDRIEVGTFMIASVLTNGNVNLLDCMSVSLLSIINKLKVVGARIEVDGRNIRVIGSSETSSANFKTFAYPGFPTDLQAPFMVLMCLSKGVSIICESIFKNRFFQVKELNKMGADITVTNNLVIIKGVKKLVGTRVIASDLRASASLVLAGLVAKGITVIEHSKYLERGYEDIENKIKRLGGIIKLDK